MKFLLTFHILHSIGQYISQLFSIHSCTIFFHSLADRLQNKSGETKEENQTNHICLEFPYG